MKPKFITSDKVVVYLTTYKGQLFRGISKCNLTDTFDLEFGKKLAKYRADLAINETILNQIRFAKKVSLVVLPKFSANWHKESLLAEKRQLVRIRTLKKRIKDLIDAGTTN
jgi:hypothetical protein